MAASQAWQLYVGRFLLGLGAGLEITISPVYIHETTRPNMRDVCGSFPQVSVLHSHWSRNVEAQLSLVERCCYASSLMP